MPPYLGTQYFIFILHAGGSIEKKAVPKEQYDTAHVDHDAKDAGYTVVGRAWDTEAELFGVHSGLKLQLIELGYNVRTIFPTHSAESNAGNNAPAQSSFARRLGKALAKCLADDELLPDMIEYALVAGTAHNFLLILNLNKAILAPEADLPTSYTANGVEYPVLGKIRNNKPHFTAPDTDLFKYYNEPGKGVEYRWHDLVEKEKQAAADEMEQQKLERKREKQREKRQRKKTTA